MLPGRVGIDWRVDITQCQHGKFLFSNSHECWYNCISTRKMFYICYYVCFISLVYPLFVRMLGKLLDACIPLIQISDASSLDDGSF
jgi:hypothetical protein